MSPAPTSDRRVGFWPTMHADLVSNVDPTGRSTLSFWVAVLGKCFLAPQVRAVIMFRIAHELSRLRLRPWALLLKARNLSQTGADIHPNATIGPGFCLVHTSGVVIGQGSTIGSDCRMHQGVTIGEPGRGSHNGMLNPVIGNGVTIGAHAVIFGPAIIGDGVVIGANAVVSSDIPSHSVAAGVPARILRSTHD